ncbi:U3 small nucleolar ribonucleoprotein protein MPP10 [Neltuma alba]|uniref:U3 small nucleolar ribonucleoprotein protein MPP10 n=1 Tax=Neltuma alba TaxID=207710 RepID=UPI0010A3E6FA|nr:U3 small nucleolar ribonucleoprotein protein MPP10 [Prosopis alba]
MASSTEAGVEALYRLQAKDPVPWLTRDPSLTQTARVASQYLFSFLRPFSKKSPLDELLVDGFDAEQIWQQIDLQSQPLFSTLRRRLKQLEESPEAISGIKGALQGKKKVEGKTKEEWHEESDGFDEELDEFDDDDDDDEEGVDEEGKEGEERGKAVAEDEENEEEEEEEGLENEEDEEEGDYGGIQDDFLKMKDLEKFLVQEENNLENDEAGQLKEVDDESDEAGEFGVGNDDDDGDEDADDFRYAIYEDFFRERKGRRSQQEKGRKEKRLKLKERLTGTSEGSGEDDVEFDGGPEHSDEDDMELDGQVNQKGKFTQGLEDSDEDGMEFDGQNQEAVSTHEKQTQKIQAKIQQMEKSNLEPKTWTMQGEVTATKRPLNSALEVDLDFEQNMRPAPVITEEVTASIEEMIQKRILEGRFDDVQRAPKLPAKAPREVKELDENKSKKGLAEVYEEEYVQKTDPSSAPLSFKDEQKKEASTLFKRLCLKLDALSHFNFAPKPVIEDMSIQANVPALAMEEIAPVAVSDAAMLAPEEVFAGKGDIKEEAELTKAERKRRRANKKRKFKAETVKKMSMKARHNTAPSQTDGQEQ